MQRQRGLTLLELLVVLAIIGFAMAGVSLAMRDSSQTQLEREAQRLTAQLEAARAQSRTSGVALIWRTTADGYDITSAVAGSGLATRREAWLSPSTQAHVNSIASNPNATATNWVVLGPEPIIAPASITLTVTAEPGNTVNANRAPQQQQSQQLRIATDGLRPFQVMP
ncbi:prepilin-type N-terminal cleavage/methylation domain-containing protein [Limnohabitans sp. B9-3]|uniref:prepilin-type N-terminal cleavage/methylation domain-containing protein n=1 Tax=Limnohabitans sp. B9-3 TaxID=1100707 RepID=UPI000C1F5D98|nr:prepilin-type N-terminal cleavage/methylation domain-containing protein [Limnohabitans sp. B9-3]